MKKEDDVAILDDIFLALRASFARFSGTDPSAEGYHIVIRDYFSADEPLLDVGVDFACCDLSCCPFSDGPGTCFHFSSGDLVDQPEK